ncbi:MAG: ABC transporter permease [Stackebrandtia sp.]
MSAQIRSQAQYRTSFAFDVAGQTIFTALDFVTVFVLFRVTPALGGFGVVEVLTMTAISGLGFSLADIAVGNVERLRFYVRTGLLDAMLIRPRRVLPQLLAVDFQLRRIGRIAFSAAILGVAASLADVDWTWQRLALLAAAPIAAAVFFCSVFVVTASVAFWWIESGEFANGFTYGGKDFTAYPMTVYEGMFRRVFAFGLGFGFVVYYPALAILGVPDPLGMPTWFGAGGFVVAAAVATLAALVWRAGIRHYKGTGS